MYPERYISLRYKIHAGYMYICKGDQPICAQDTCEIYGTGINNNVIYQGYMFMKYMYLKCIQREMYLI